MFQCRLRVKYRTVRIRGNERGDTVIKSVKGARRRMRALRSGARNKRPKEAKKNQKRGIERAQELPVERMRMWTREESERSLRGSLAVSQVARVRAG